VQKSKETFPGCAQKNGREGDQYNHRQIDHRESRGQPESGKRRTPRDESPRFVRLHHRHAISLLLIDLIESAAIAEVFGLRVLPAAAPFQHGEGVDLGKDIRVLVRNRL